MLHGDFFKGVITVLEKHEAMEELTKEFVAHHGSLGMALHAFMTPPFWLALAGVVAAYVFYMLKPDWPAAWKRTLAPIYTILDNKYYFDRFNEVVFAGGARLLGTGFWKVGDVGIIDSLAINGSARVVGWIARLTGWFQSGSLYQYAVVMMIAVFFSLSMIFRLLAK
jgi:NADH-quinone oxidoreductase subunit L